MKSWFAQKPSRRALLSLAVVPFVYLIPVNLALNLGVLQHLINEKPEEIQMTWSSAFSPWPGRAIVYHYDLRAQDDGVQWELTVDRAVTSVVLRSLFHKRFETAWVHARGVVFRLRPQKTPESTPEVLATYPPIRGSPWRPPPNAKAKKPPSGRTPWSVRLEDASVEGVREAWIGPYRGALNVKVHGRLFFIPNKKMQVGPASVQCEWGELFQGKTLPVITGLQGTVNAQFALGEPAPLDLTGLSVLHALKAAVRLHGTLASLDFVGYYLQGGLDPELEGGRAPFQVDLTLERGALGVGSEILFQGEPWRAKLGEYRLNGGFSLHAQVVNDKGAPRTKLALDLTPLGLKGAHGTKLLESPSVRLSVEAAGAVLGDRLQQVALGFDLARTPPFALRPLNGFIPAQVFEIESGTGVLHANLHSGVGSKSAEGGLVFKTGKVWTRSGKSRVTGQLTATVDLERVKLEKQSADISGTTLRFEDVGVFTERDRKQSWNGTLALDSARLSLKSPFLATADVAGVFSDARPFLALFGDQAGIPRFLTPVLEAKNLHVGGHVTLAGPRVRFKDLVARAENLAINGQLALTPDNTAGLFLFNVHGFELGMKVNRGRSDVQLSDPGAWYQRELQGFQKGL